jgi:hypothetical protein
MIYIFQFCDFVSLATSHEGFIIKWQHFWKNFLHSLKIVTKVQSESKCGEKVSIFYKWKFSDFLKNKWVYSERTFFFFFRFWPNFAPKENIGHHTNANHNLGLHYIYLVHRYLSS